jgi:hypothetical protein
MYTAKMSKPTATMTTMMTMASPAELKPPELDDAELALCPSLMSQRVPLKPDWQLHERVLWLSPTHVPPFMQ